MTDATRLLEQEMPLKLAPVDALREAERRIQGARDMPHDRGGSQLRPKPGGGDEIHEAPVESDAARIRRELGVQASW